MDTKSESLHTSNGDMNIKTEMDTKRIMLLKIYGVPILWEVNAQTGKVDMTVDEVMESVEVVIQTEKEKALKAFAEEIKGIVDYSDMNPSSKKELEACLARALGETNQPQ